MNLGLHLYNYLQEKGSAELPGFAFYPQEKSATLDEQSSKNLATDHEISFVENKNVFQCRFF